ncbi:Ubiquinone biosynthesis O-methyltransferase, mitochondrial [Halomonadaceae bacterium LMG 33818]|uniref:class I SAM-dependent methyltransferase n=1 Tax=Cernens ardua TaxID=3402176 RepID=UPI003EDC774B
MADLHYEHAQLALLYDLENRWGVSDDFYLALAEKCKGYILDMGCGTGLLSNAMAALGCKVTAVDPALAMIEIGKAREFAPVIEWVSASVDSFQSDKRYALTIMAGNVFQVFVNDIERLSALRNLHKYMVFEGIIAFECRNPDVDWATRWETSAVPIAQNISRSRHILAASDSQITFETHYYIDDKELISTSTLGFVTRQQLEKLMVQSSFRIKTVFGNWDGSPFEPEHSDVMIVIAEAI